MLTENKFSKYLLYAIGEIVLVVIGILIALSINNWNESNKEQNILNASLISLKLNIKEDVEDLNKQIKYNKAVLEDIDFSFRIISLPKFENMPLSKYADSIIDIATERIFTPTNTAFKSMESGSHFRWINNQELAESIYKYYEFLDNFSDNVSGNNQFIKNHMEGFVYNVMELGTFFPKANPYSNDRSFKLDNTKILRGNPIFENALIGRKFRAIGEIRKTEKAIVNATELIIMIDEYLNENN